MRRLLCLAALLLLNGTAAAVLPAQVMHALRAADIPADALSVHVQSVEGGLPRISHRAKQPMNPASVMKLVTTYAALDMLGPAWAWRTELYTTGTVRDGVLDGDLYIRGSGDPALTLEQFWLLLRDVRSRGVRDIRGDVVTDRSRFATLAHDPGAFDNEPLAPYNVGPDALMLALNALRIRITPLPGGVQLWSEPPLDGMTLDARVQLVAGDCGDWKDGLLARLIPGAQGGLTLQISGRYARNCGERVWNVSPLPHADFFARALRAMWMDMGGRIGGQVRDGRVPAEAQPLTAIDSPPLAAIVRDINKFSNNVMARQLFLSLSPAGSPADVPGADAALRAWLARRGLSMPSLVMENGSGLSRTERLSALDLARLLRHAWNSPVMPEFVSSMPVLAVDGTLRRRLKNSPAAGQAHMKTGSLADTRSIAGYMLDRNGQRVLLVAWLNHPNASRAQPVLEALLEWVWLGNPAALPVTE
ncbi:D-alanyl-D-alanine carboxypeptidase/D-alanyl-D-alanine endopeptidase [Methyloversatilis thermotolerans]|uniref:D-alanyl-D-alanine carboxypeptidase/D-alanyl-D-alanine endopeptidase n=1 Tax=Methyloversatilis thermotolerans TaxID=1346290 RepID=UPI00036B297C|nr:D-alanyl-D-alanine carboxypeptidase/D-alanyl-D-alanine-endopeptidase [Methyloversatilis thermotolerans]